jgi:hypothetical protein
VSEPPLVTTHRLRFATPVADLVRWPDDFGRRFMVSVDAEEEFDWSRPFTRGARSVTAIGALPAMHARLAARGVPVTYMVDHPVASDPGAAATIAALLADNVSAVGAQLHPWVNPPHDEFPSDAASFAGNLPTALEAAKLDQLIAAIEGGIGRRPLAYRAGRYGIGPDTIRLLVERGFRVDTSMRARFDYRAAGGTDFSAIGNAAFRLAPGLIELPLSAVFTGTWRARGPALYGVTGRVPRGRGVLSRAGLLSRVPMTPEGTPLSEALAAVAVAARDGERLLHLSFHSPTLVPGNTPYVRDAADLARFHRWWDAVLDALAHHGFSPAALDEIIRAAD